MINIKELITKTFFTPTENNTNTFLTDAIQEVTDNESMIRFGIKSHLNYYGSEQLYIAQQNERKKNSDQLVNKLMGPSYDLTTDISKIKRVFQNSINKIEQHILQENSFFTDDHLHQYLSKKSRDELIEQQVLIASKKTKIEVLMSDSAHVKAGFIQLDKAIEEKSHLIQSSDDLTALQNTLKEQVILLDKKMEKLVDVGVILSVLYIYHDNLLEQHHHVTNLTDTKTTTQRIQQLRDDFNSHEKNITLSFFD
jgi:hypothetical protein